VKRKFIFLFCCIVFVFCAVQLVADNYKMITVGNTDQYWSENHQWATVVASPKMILRFNHDGTIEIWPRRIIKGIKLNWEE